MNYCYYGIIVLGQGIGKRCAQLFAKEGSKVVVTDIDAGELDSN